MPPAADVPGPGALPAPGEAPLERFRPTSGQFLGWTTVALCAALAGWAALTVPTLLGLRLVLGAGLVGVVTYLTQLRPRAVLYPSRLVLRNTFRDASVPLRLVDEVGIGRTLSVFVGDRRYVCIGIGRSLRKVMGRGKGSGPASLIGFDRLEAYHDGQTPPSPDQTSMDYDTFVVTRIEAQVEEAKQLAPRNDGSPREVWAWPGIATLAVTTLAFLASLLA